jgi:hypothetical protein
LQRGAGGLRSCDLRLLRPRGSRLWHTGGEVLSERRRRALHLSAQHPLSEGPIIF